MTRPVESGVRKMLPQGEANACCIGTLYHALQDMDAQAAAACYAKHAYFEDIAFRLDGRRAIGQMWDLVCSVDLEVEIGPIAADDTTGIGYWIASYPPVVASQERKHDKSCYVRNPITSSFRFDGDGLILSHRDHCDPKAWAAMAFPFPISAVMGNVALIRSLLARIKLASHVPPSRP